MPDTPQDADPGQENAAHEETKDTGEPDLNTSRDSERSGEREVSPSVRRLLRQYDLDIDSIRGTGPGGRVRPSDVLAIVGNPQLMRHSSGTTADFADDPSRAPERSPARAQRAVARAETPPVAVTVFNCNMSRVLAHRQRTGLTNVSVACYVAKAAGLAATKLAYLKTAAGRFPIRLVLTDAAGDSECVAENPGTDAVEAIQRTANSPGSRPAAAARPRIALFHHGLPGHLIDYRSPEAEHEAAALCVGGLNRVIRLTACENGESPRIAIQSQLSLSYRVAVVRPGDAARFMAECVRLLETWPVPNEADAPDVAADPAAL